MICNSNTKYKKRDIYSIYNIYLRVNKNNSLSFIKSFNYFIRYKKS